MNAPSSTLLESLRGLRGSFEAARKAAAALKDQTEHLAAGFTRLSSARQAGAHSWLRELEEIRQDRSLATSEAAKGENEIQTRLATLERQKQESLERFSGTVAELVETLKAAGGQVDQNLADLGWKFDGLSSQAGRRHEEGRRYLRETAACLSLLDGGGRTLQAELSRLQDLFAQQAELCRTRGRAKRRAKAVLATEAGFRALQAGGLPQAEARFREAHELSPSPATQFNLALGLCLAGQQEAADRLLADRALNECDPVELQLLRALNALRAGNSTLALREAEAGLQVRPDHRTLRQLAAVAALAANSGATAIRHLAETDLAARPQRPAEPAPVSALPQPEPGEPGSSLNAPAASPRAVSGGKPKKR